MEDGMSILGALSLLKMNQEVTLMAEWLLRRQYNREEE